MLDGKDEAFLAERMNEVYPPERVDPGPDVLLGDQDAGPPPPYEPGDPGPDAEPPARPEKESPAIELIGLVDIGAMNFESNPVIDGLLDQQESLIIVAESGTGKSMILNQILFSMAVPPIEGLFGRFTIRRPVTSLLMQSENSMKSTSFRLKRIFAAHPEFLQQAGYRVMTFKVGHDIRMSGDFRRESFQKQIIDALLSIEADVLVVDPLISFHDSDENSNVEMRASLDALTFICDQANVACILTHHTGKKR